MLYRQREVLKLIEDYAFIEGDCHKQWLLDQIVRVITGDEYDNWVREWEQGGSDDEDDWGEWEEGIAP